MRLIKKKKEEGKKYEEKYVSEDCDARKKSTNREALSRDLGAVKPLDPADKTVRYVVFCVQKESCLSLKEMQLLSFYITVIHGERILHNFCMEII